MVTFDPPENVGGVEGRAAAYAEGLGKKNFVDVVAFGPSYDYALTTFHGAALHRFPSSSKLALRSFVLAVGDASTNSIDSIFLLSGALTLFGLLMLTYARLTARRSLIFLYGKDILGARGSLLESVFLFVAARLTSKIAVNSKFTAGLLPARLAKKTGVLYPGVDPQIASHASGDSQVTDRAKTILFVGRLVERKGADDLIRAFSRLDDKGGDIRLEIVGDGPEMGRLQRLVSDLGLEDEVRFFGTLTGPPLYQRFAHCDVFAMPSKTTKEDVEGFGTVFLEAGLFGKPSVSTTAGGIPEAIRNGETGIVVSEGDQAALTEALREMISNDEKRERFGENARNLVLSAFTWDASNASLTRLLEESGKQ